MYVTSVHLSETSQLNITTDLLGEDEVYIQEWNVAWLSVISTVYPCTALLHSEEIHYTPTKGTHAQLRLQYCKSRIFCMPNLIQ